MEDKIKKQKSDPIIFILEGAPLKIANISKEIVLLNAEEHTKYIKKKLGQMLPIKLFKKSLLTLLDSPLAKSGNLQVFVRTYENVLIKIDSTTKIPRTYKRFAGLFAQLLKNLKIRAVNTSVTLLKVIKNPITDHLPLNTLIIGTSTKGKLVKLDQYVKKLDNKRPLAFVVGAVAKGNPGILISNGSRLYT